MITTSSFVDFTTMTLAGSYFDFQNPGNVKEQDTSYATCPSHALYPTIKYSNYISCQNLETKCTYNGCQWDAGQVTNITWHIRMKAGIQATETYSCRMIFNGSAYGSDYADPDAEWGIAFSEVTYNWNQVGISLTTGDVNSSNFGVALSAQTRGETAQIDRIWIVISYLGPNIYPGWDGQAAGINPRRLYWRNGDGR